MEIEIVTTKKRLTKSIVNQMKLLRKSEIPLISEVVGHIAYHSIYHSVCLFRIETGEYRIMPPPSCEIDLWNENGARIYCVKKHEPISFIVFGPNERSLFEKLKEFLDLAVERQIFLTS